MAQDSSSLRVQVSGCADSCPVRSRSLGSRPFLRSEYSWSARDPRRTALRILTIASAPDRWLRPWSRSALTELSILNPPTFAALSSELDRAEREKNPYQVVHFDGHAVFDRSRCAARGDRRGLGALVFEHPNDVNKTQSRRGELVDCNKLATLMRERPAAAVFPRCVPDCPGRDGPDLVGCGHLAAKRRGVRGGDEPRRARGNGEAVRRVVLQGPAARRPCRSGDVGRTEGPARRRQARPGLWRRADASGLVRARALPRGDRPPTGAAGAGTPSAG